MSLLALAPGTAAAQNHIGDRDRHYGQGSHRQYDHYKPPRVYYPKRMEDVEKPAPPPSTDMRNPGGPLAPSYGAPPPALKRVPKT